MKPVPTAARNPWKPPSIAVGMLLLMLSSACDNVVEPFTEAIEAPFAVFGFLDVTADTQFVLVSPVQPSFELEGGGLTPVSVRSRKLDSDEFIQWSDSVIALDDGTNRLLYYAVFHPEPGASYALEVVAAEGEPTRAFTRVPDGTRFTLSNPREDTLGFIRQRALWPGVTLARSTIVEYRVQGIPSRGLAVIALPYDRFASSSSGSWSVDVQLELDRAIVVRRVQNLFGDTLVTLRDIRMSVVVQSSEWSADGEGSNIQNGRGFFASVGEFSHSWMPDSAVVAQIGYVP